MIHKWEKRHHLICRHRWEENSKTRPIAAQSSQKQQNATQRSNAEHLEKAAEAGAIAGIKRAFSLKTVLRVIFVILKP